MNTSNYSISNSKTFLSIRRINNLIILIAVILSTAKANVSNYSFASSSGTYTTITGTTLFASNTTTRWDDGASALQTIPFTFTYSGVAYTKVGVNSNGFITLGSVSNSPANYCGLQASDVNSIAGYGTDLVGGSLLATSRVAVGSRGSAPNRQFVIQWTDCAHYTNGTYSDHWSFQIILNETTNTVQIVWGTNTTVSTMGANNCADAATESGSVGLLGASTNDYNLRSVTNGTNTWATSVAGTAINAVCNMSSTNIPASGLTYTWTPGPIVAMGYSASTTSFLNTALGLPRGSTDIEIIQIKVITSGSLSPMSVNSLTLSTSGCTNAATDIINAKVYYTGISGIFSTATQFGTTAINPNGSFTVTGDALLAEGVNYFWLTYDLSNTANFGDNLTACCTQIIGTGTIGTVTPAITCPVGRQTIYEMGTWAPVSASPPFANKGHMLLLSDGTAICKSAGGGSDGYGNIWTKLTPDNTGSYANGSWSTIAPMNDTRLWFSSQILKDGKVYVAGGEYGTGLSTAEVYNPLTDVWTATPLPGGTVSDANSAILEDGRVLQAMVSGALTSTKIYNPVTNTFAVGPTALGIHNESAWVKLKDKTILYVNRLATSSERYNPVTNKWIADAAVPVSLYDPYGDETGAAFLLPDGRAFFLGSTGHTAYYTPSGTTAQGVWAAGPDIPSGKGTPDAGAAMMANGKIICAVSPAPTAHSHFPSPTSFYEFDYLTNSFTLLPPPSGINLNKPSYYNIFLDLPDGTVLYSSVGSSQYNIYTPSGSQVASGKPIINNIKQNTCDSFAITGTLFNGISEGASYGDDGQMATNYPIVRLSSESNVYYARTSFWNRTAVMTGALLDTTQFKLPAGLPSGNYSLVVTANGISSDPISFNALPTLSSSLNPTAICSGSTFTYTPQGTRTNATFTWTRAAVAGISNAAITTPQSGNPNEVLINTTSASIAVVYSYTITAGTCSNTQDVVVTVNAGTAPVQNINLSGCNSVLYNGNTYTSSIIKTDTLKSIPGCDSIIVIANITVTKTPVISSVTYNNPVLIGGDIHLNVVAANAVGYLWTGPNSFTSASPSPVILSATSLASGTYYVIAINGICTKKDSVIVVVNSGTSYTISGKIVTPTNKIIQGETVSLSGTANTNTTPNATGIYSFNSVFNGNYIIKPKKNNDIVKNNGVSAIDIILVQNHILNKTLLSSPYKIIAADVNNDKKVTAIDVIFMKRLILGVDTTFTGNRLWAFVDSAYTFPNPANPFPYKDSISYTGLSATQSNQSFIGVKLGDVDFNWNATVAKQTKADNTPVELYYNVISIPQFLAGEKSHQTDFSGSPDSYRDRNGGIVRIPIKVKNFKALLGMQYTLNFNNDSYEYAGIENNLLNIDFNDKRIATNNGRIPFLWTDANNKAITLEDGTVLFELILKRKNDNRLAIHDELSLSNDITNIEAYDKDLNKHDIILTKVATTKDQRPTPKDSWTVSPNPTTGTVKVEFVSIIDKTIHFELTNSEGKLLLQQNIEATKGNSSFSINLKQKQPLPVGVYYLKAIGLEGDEVKRIVIQ